MPGEPYGSFTGAFGGTITFEWAPDPLIVAKELEGMASALNNMIMPLEASRQIAAQDIQRRFDTKTAPDGSPWEPWSWSYADRAAATNVGGLLEKTGAMRAAAASPSAFDVNAYVGGGEVVFTGAGLPDYWMAHQEGATRTRSGASELKAAGFGDIGANVLPARPFVGLSEEGELAIVDIFDEWFAGVTGFFVGAGGNVQRRLSSGRFGPRVAL